MLCPACSGKSCRRRKLTDKKEHKDVHNLEDLNDELNSSVNLEALLNEAIQDADKAVKGNSGKTASQDSSDNIASAINDMLGGLDEKQEKVEKTAAAPAGLVEIEGEETVDEPVSSREQEYYDRLLRVTANFENYKKRVVKEKDDFMRYALSDFAVQLLPVLDNFERALAQIEARGAEKIAEGVRMIYRQMLDVMQKNGVRSIESVGKPFDPTKHQAVELRESDEVAPECVIEELQRGYFLRDRLLRPAMVVVAKAMESVASEAEPESEAEVLDESALNEEVEAIEEVEPIEEE